MVKVGSGVGPAPEEKIAVQILLIEDDEDDALLVGRQLGRSGLEVDLHRVNTADRVREALATRTFSCVISDYAMPGFDGLTALRIVREHDPDLPFIVISGTLGERHAVELMRAGAQDYVMKGALARLGPAISREVTEAENRRSRRRLEDG